MKLWKSKKCNHNNANNSSSGGSTSTISCVPGKSSSLNKTSDAKADTATTSSTTVSGMWPVNVSIKLNTNYNQKSLKLFTNKFPPPFLLHTLRGSVNKQAKKKINNGA